MPPYLPISQAQRPQHLSRSGTQTQAAHSQLKTPKLTLSKINPQRGPPHLPPVPFQYSRRQFLQHFAVKFKLNCSKYLPVPRRFFFFFWNLQHPVILVSEFKMRPLLFFSSLNSRNPSFAPPPFLFTHRHFQNVSIDPFFSPDATTIQNPWDPKPLPRKSDHQARNTNDQTTLLLSAAIR